MSASIMTTNNAPSAGDYHHSFPQSAALKIATLTQNVVNMNTRHTQGGGPIITNGNTSSAQETGTSATQRCNYPAVVWSHLPDQAQALLRDASRRRYGDTSFPTPPPTGPAKGPALAGNSRVPIKIAQLSAFNPAAYPFCPGAPMHLTRQEIQVTARAPEAATSPGATDVQAPRSDGVQEADTGSEDSPSASSQQPAAARPATRQDQPSCNDVLVNTVMLPDEHHTQALLGALCARSNFGESTDNNGNSVLAQVMATLNGPPDSKPGPSHPTQAVENPDLVPTIGVAPGRAVLPPPGYNNVPRGAFRMVQPPPGLPGSSVRYLPMNYDLRDLPLPAAETSRPLDLPAPGHYEVPLRAVLRPPGLDGPAVRYLPVENKAVSRPPGFDNPAVRYLPVDPNTQTLPIPAFNGNSMRAVFRPPGLPGSPVRYLPVEGKAVFRPPGLSGSPLRQIPVEYTQQQASPIAPWVLELLAKHWDNHVRLQCHRATAAESLTKVSSLNPTETTTMGSVPSAPAIARPDRLRALLDSLPMIDTSGRIHSSQQPQQPGRPSDTVSLIYCETTISDWGIVRGDLPPVEDTYIPDYETASTTPDEHTTSEESTKSEGPVIPSWTYTDMHQLNPDSYPAVHGASQAMSKQDTSSSESSRDPDSDNPTSRTTPPPVSEPRLETEFYDPFHLRGISMPELCRMYPSFALGSHALVLRAILANHRPDKPEGLSCPHPAICPCRFVGEDEKFPYVLRGTGEWTMLPMSLCMDRERTEWMVDKLIRRHESKCEAWAMSRRDESGDEEGETDSGYHTRRSF